MLQLGEGSRFSLWPHLVVLPGNSLNIGGGLARSKWDEQTLKGLSLKLKNKSLLQCQFQEVFKSWVEASRYPGGQSRKSALHRVLNWNDAQLAFRWTAHALEKATFMCRKAAWPWVSGCETEAGIKLGSGDAKQNPFTSHIAKVVSAKWKAHPTTPFRAVAAFPATQIWDPRLHCDPQAPR